MMMDVQTLQSRENYTHKMVNVWMLSFAEPVSALPPVTRSSRFSNLPNPTANKPDSSASAKKSTSLSVLYTCVFCSKSLFDGQPVVVLRQKGCDGIGKVSIARDSELRTVVGQSVHVECRQEHTNPLIIQSYRKRTANDSEAVDKHVLRSS